MDLQDALLILGVASLVGGLASIDWRIGLILFGCLSLLAVYLIARGETPAQTMQNVGHRRQLTGNVEEIRIPARPELKRDK